MAEDFRLIGVDAWQTAVDGIVARMEIATRGAVVEAAHAIEAATKADAPVKSGTLRRSIKVDGPHREGFGDYTASVGPTAVYGRRIELGYTGPDAWGRSFNQPPHEYFKPGTENVMGRLGEIYSANWAAALKH